MDRIEYEIERESEQQESLKRFFNRIFAVSAEDSENLAKYFIDIREALRDIASRLVESDI